MKVMRFVRFSLGISEITKYLYRIEAEELQRYDLKGAHSLYIMSLYQHPEGITATELSKVCGRDKADVSRMIGSLFEKGLIQKEGGYHNRYGGSWRLTKEGMQLAHDLQNRIEYFVEEAGKGLTQDNREMFYESLEQIAKNLKHLWEKGEDSNGNSCDCGLNI